MPSNFYIQIVEQGTREIVCGWEPGSRVEADLIAQISARLKAKRIGLGTTAARVTASVEDAVRDLLYDLKSQVRPH